MIHAVEGLVFRSASNRRAGRAVFVLIHGIGMSHRYLRRLHAELATDADVHTIDLPGFGGLPTPDQTPDVGEMAQGLGVVLDELGVRRAVLVGHSMGAQWVVELAIRRPDLADAVVAIGPVTDDRRRGALTQALLLARDSALEPLGANAIVLTDYLRCGPVWYARQARHMLRYPLEERVSRLRMPLLVVRGGSDPIAREAWARRLSDRALSGTLCTVEGHRHLVQFTAATVVAARIRAFALDR
ncbi:alpha/beta fold hydrolase [Microbacterium trichothecenolyticum]|uniref:Pimeloyl-ACP methyl ester carboxylesterase n=1 Tax=Microbacterium trichothecenolyticum TaxID=69370 RepID=A0ABU0TVL6_MICTR|nr:alpha/beta hydrolase [Microbacterium trichothecenolyticum]MDQ1123708.1 pimeloyl-ACP methyl ester carboxylesterase [Microbacterium trichothecenolyticum]